MLSVKVPRDANLSPPCPEPPLFSGPAVWNEPRDRFTGLCKHNFLACSSFFDEPRQMSFCRLYVDSLHLRLSLVWFKRRQQQFCSKGDQPHAHLSSAAR